MAKMVLEIKDKKVNTIIRSYGNTKNIKMYFNGVILNISKPKRINNKKILEIVKQNEEEIYSKYLEINRLNSDEIKHWITGEKILYRGKYYEIKRKKSENNKIKIFIDNDNLIFDICIPRNIIDEEIIKYNVDKIMKKIFKEETEKLLQNKLKYWKEITKIEYTSFNVRDAKSKYGSCKPLTRQLYFSSRLIMLPEDVINAIIVHELYHIIYKNHSKKFYDLVKKFIPNYDEIDKWLKKNSKEINF